ncbi:hypothetical protein U1Q18_038675 [Sarracenia purpurea var. burkii]
MKKRRTNRVAGDEDEDNHRFFCFIFSFVEREKEEWSNLCTFKSLFSSTVSKEIQCFVISILVTLVAGEHEEHDDGAVLDDDLAGELHVHVFGDNGAQVQRRQWRIELDVV